ncbi:hypothetical protein BDK51DRAFT_47994 [Blyttiomyces helicus]|uniref:Uncharacterized protein n=1 Tax=Blyttiomyces helicus TaxID=388810 RepID=A0A4V1IQD1_9FUNG|nr:hypothetical protein BDK51DRAFT_47994 [Blyttiomyces helicus]|eukprot:RKO86137.1 hypothetical protein BDK51DRAFT_47994 [Blyttiomyces helicus]
MSGPGKKGRPAKFVFKHAVLSCLLNTTATTWSTESPTRCSVSPPQLCRESSLLTSSPWGKLFRKPPTRRSAGHRFMLMPRWLHSTLVTRTPCYLVDGTLVWGKQAALGLGTIAKPAENFSIAWKILRKTSQAMIFTAFKKGDLERTLKACQRALQARSNSITALRQAEALGMGSAALVFRQLDQKLPYHPHI